MDSLTITKRNGFSCRIVVTICHKKLPHQTIRQSLLLFRYLTCLLDRDHIKFYARLIMYNFAGIITLQVVINRKQRKHIYKANFSVAVHMCRLFYQNKTTSPCLEAIVAKNLVPVRPGRHKERNLTPKIYHGFLYRVA